MATGVYLEIDASDLDAELTHLRSVLTPEQFERTMRGIFARTGGHVRKIVKTDVPKKYEVPSGEVGRAVKNAKTTTSGLGVGCSIPVVGARRDLGGTRGRGFPAYGGAHGWHIKGPYQMQVKIIKGRKATLPFRMSSYGGQPHFRNRSAPQLHNLVFTRAGQDRLPIRKVEGIAIPQMPMNRAQPEVQKDIMEYMRGRIEHEFQRVIAGH